MQTEKKEFNKKLISLVIPITLQQLMVALVGLSDALMTGLIDQDSLSAVSLATQVQFVYSLFLYGVMAGASIFVAQYRGKGDMVAVEKVLGIGLKLSAIIGFVFTACAFTMPTVIMHAFTSDTVLIEKGAEYLRAVSLSYFMLSISQIYLAVMKNCNRAALSSTISIVSIIVNIVFNYLLIFGIGIFPEMGIKGAAVATVISKAVELVWALIVATQKRSVKIRARYIAHMDKLLFTDYKKCSLPLLCNQLAWGLGFTMYTVIMGHMGSDATAANSIANIVKNLTICVCDGVGVATGVIIGTELGAGRLKKAKEYGARFCKLAIISGVCAGVIILCVIPFVPMFTTLSETAQGYLKTMLVVCSYYVVGKSINITTIAGIFPAGADTKFGFKCDTITMWCVTVPLGLISAFVLGLSVTAVYMIINIDEIIKLPAVYKNYKKYNWVKDLTQDISK